MNQRTLALIAVSTVTLASCSTSGGQMIDNGGLPAENDSTAFDGTKWEIRYFQKQMKILTQNNLLTQIWHNNSLQPKQNCHF